MYICMFYVNMYVDEQQRYFYGSFSELEKELCTKCALPYACLAVGYLEETKLFTKKPTYFNESECKFWNLWSLCKLWNY